jgi:hypothetical protein
MKFVKNTQPNRIRKTGKRVLLGETLEEEAARLEKEIAAHPVTRCEPGERSPSSSRPGWSSKPFIPLSERTVAEGIAKKRCGKKSDFASSRWDSLPTMHRYETGHHGRAS